MAAQWRRGDDELAAQWGKGRVRARWRYSLLQAEGQGGKGTAATNDGIERIDDARKRTANAP
jgi:hypothetical protein